MKVTVLNNKKPYKSSSIFSNIILLVLGILLVFHSNGIISIIFTILGVAVLLFGISRFCRYFQLKNQFHTEETEILIQAVTSSFVALLIIFLSNFIANTIQIVTGIWLLFSGVSKLNHALYWKKSNNSRFIQEVVGSCVLIILGIYTIIAQNVVFVFIGIVLILYAIAGIVQYFLEKR